MITRVVEPVAVHKIMACLASFVAPVVVESVMSASVEMVVVPAIAASTKEVIELFTKSPQVLSFSPVAGSAKPNKDVYEVDMIFLVTVR